MRYYGWSIVPGCELPGHTGKPRRFAEIQAGNPVIIVLAREAYVAEDQLQHAGLAQLWPEMTPGAGYCRLVIGDSGAR